LDLLRCAWFRKKCTKRSRKWFEIRGVTASTIYLIIAKVVLFCSPLIGL
jgi:hypothetical protein